MLASFSVVPIGAGEEVRELVAAALAVVADSGLPYSLGAMQTTVEGDETRVMSVIMDCHRRVRALCPRVLTHIAIDDREGATNRLSGKIRDVESVLGRKLCHE
jgi:uncharacterized protein (TIGR00106 family)